MSYTIWKIGPFHVLNHLLYRITLFFCPLPRFKSFNQEVLCLHVFFYHFYSCLRIEDYTIIVVYLVLGTIFFIILIRFVIAIIIYIFSSSFLTFLMFFQWSLWSAWAGDASCDQCDARRAGSYRTSVFVSSLDLLFGLKCFPLSFTDNLKMFF